MKTKIYATVTYSIDVIVEVDDDASEQEQRDAIFELADIELDPYGNGVITKCSNSNLEE